MLKFLSIFIFTLLTISPVFGSIIVPADVVEGQDSERNFVGRKGHFEKTANGVNGYDDGSAATPVDGTGGATITTTCTRTTTTPLDGDGSLIITKDAADRRGEGCSLDFTIPSAMKAKVAQIEFDYQVASGTFAAGSSSTNSDVIAYIYDVTNSTLIEPSSIKLLSNSSTITDRFVANFQTSATGTNYRLMFHISTTSSSAWVLEVDSIKIKPSKYVYGTPITDWVSYTPTGSWSTNTTYTGKWRRVGDSMELSATASLAGAPNSAQFTVNLPSGYTIDTTKMNGLGPAASPVGSGAILDSGTQVYPATVYYSTSTSVTITYGAANGAGVNTNNGLVNQANPMTFGINDIVGINATVPITGWSSSTQVSDGYDGRLVFARYSTNASQSLTSGSITIINFEDQTKDLTASVTVGGSWKFTAPSYGFYKVKSKIIINTAAAWADGEAGSLRLYKNGSQYSVLDRKDNQPTNTFMPLVGSDVVELNAGDYVDVRVDQNSGSTLNIEGSGDQNYVVIEKLQATTTISATEVVAAYGSITSTLTTTNSLLTLSVTRDTHGAISGSVFTVPVSGFYAFSGGLRGAAGAAGGQVVNFGMAKNGALSSFLWSNWTSDANAKAAVVSGIDFFNAGETISFRGYTDTVTFGNFGNTHFSIHRIK